MSGKLASRSKDWCFKVFLKCDSKILDALGALGSQSDPSPEIYAQLERFVCLIYKSEVLTEVKDLRWFLFSNRAAEGESVPPTTGSLSYTYGELLATSGRYGEEQQRATHPFRHLLHMVGNCLRRKGHIHIFDVSTPSSWSSNKFVTCGCKKTL